MIAKRRMVSLLKKESETFQRRGKAAKQANTNDINTSRPAQHKLGPLERTINLQIFSVEAGNNELACC